MTDTFSGLIASAKLSVMVWITPVSSPLRGSCANSVAKGMKEKSF